DIARRGRLAPPFGQRTAGLALEIDDEDIVLDDQHLPEMEIAMVADVQAVDGSWKQRAQAVMQGRAWCERLIDKETIGFLYRIAALLQCVEDTFRAGDHVFDPELHVLGSGRVWLKVGEFVAAGEREVHFGDAPS